jgi:alanine racemase
MDCLSLNTEDEKVCIFNNVETLAKEHNTITYEITTALNSNIKKEIV